MTVLVLLTLVVGAFAATAVTAPSELTPVILATSPVSVEFGVTSTTLDSAAPVFYIGFVSPEGSMPVSSRALSAAVLVTGCSRRHLAWVPMDTVDIGPYSGFTFFRSEPCTPQGRTVELWLREHAVRVPPGRPTFGSAVFLDGLTASFSFDV
jgi:hypothetical protein